MATPKEYLAETIRCCHSEYPYSGGTLRHRFDFVAFLTLRLRATVAWGSPTKNYHVGEPIEGPGHCGTLSAMACAILAELPMETRLVSFWDTNLGRPFHTAFEANLQTDTGKPCWSFYDPTFVFWCWDGGPLGINELHRSPLGLAWDQHFSAARILLPEMPMMKVLNAHYTKSNFNG